MKRVSESASSYSTSLFDSKAKNAFLFQELRLKTRRDYFQIPFKIQGFGCKYDTKDMLCTWAHELREGGGGAWEISVSWKVHRRIKRDGRERWTRFSTSIERSRIIAVTILFKQKQITAHCCMIPSPLRKIIHSPGHFRNPACFSALAVHCARGRHGSLSMAGCSLKLSGTITFWGALGWNTSWPERKILSNIITCEIEKNYFWRNYLYFRPVYFSRTFGPHRKSKKKKNEITTALWNIYRCFGLHSMSAWNTSRVFPALPSVCRKSLHAPGRREPVVVCSEQERRGAHEDTAPLWANTIYCRVCRWCPTLQYIVARCNTQPINQSHFHEWWKLQSCRGYRELMNSSRQQPRLEAAYCTCFCFYTGSVRLPLFSPHGSLSASLLLILITSTSVEWESRSRGTAGAQFGVWMCSTLSK